MERFDRLAQPYMLWLHNKPNICYTCNCKEVVFLSHFKFDPLCGTFVVYRILKNERSQERVTAELREKSGVSTLYVDRLRTAMCEFVR